MTKLLPVLSNISQISRIGSSITRIAIALLATSLSTSIAIAEDWKQTADRWGRLHAGAIYCGIEDAHDFGVAAMEYFKKKGNFDTMREVYGLALLNAMREPPTPDIGDDCYGLPIVYNETWEIFDPKRKSGDLRRNPDVSPFSDEMPDPAPR